jgi:hypothetical protein
MPARPARSPPSEITPGHAAALTAAQRPLVIVTNGDGVDVQAGSLMVKSVVPRQV